MFGFLKQSTASQSRLVGPFVDDTDFKTLETGLTINNTDVELSKNGGVTADKNSGGGTHRANGMYSLTFDATDTNTVGELAGSISVSGALIVTFKFWVLEEAIYDSLFGASAAGFDSNQRVNVGQWLSNAVTASGGTPDVNIQSLDDIDLSATMKASVNTEADTALSDIHLDHLLAVDYDPASKPGVATALFNELIENNGGVSRFTAGALAQAPDTDHVGTGTGLTAIPWNTSWDAEVQSECADALAAYNAVATTDLPTNFADLSITVTTGLVNITQAAADKAWGTTTRVLTASTNFNDISPAEVNAEVVDALATDTYAEPSSVPASTTDLAEMIHFIYTMMRNKMTQTSTTGTLRNDGDTLNIGTSTVSDDGTTFTRGEMT